MKIKYMFIGENKRSLSCYWVVWLNRFFSFSTFSVPSAFKVSNFRWTDHEFEAQASCRVARWIIFRLNDNNIEITFFADVFCEFFLYIQYLIRTMSCFTKLLVPWMIWFYCSNRVTSKLLFISFYLFLIHSLLSLRIYNYCYRQYR